MIFDWGNKFNFDPLPIIMKLKFPRKINSLNRSGWQNTWQREFFLPPHVKSNKCERKQIPRDPLVLEEWKKNTTFIVSANNHTQGQ